MNKQELIEGLKDKSDDLKQLSIVGGYGKTNMPLLWQKSGVDYAIDLVAEHLDEPSREECEVEYLGYISNQGCTWQCSCGYYEVVESKNDEPRMFKYPYCRNCGAKIKREKRDE